MRSAARMPAEDPAPERAGLDARARAVLDTQLELVSRATALLAGCPDTLLLRQLITEVIASGLHCEELRSDMARYVAAVSAVDAAWADGWSAREAALEQDAAAAVPGPRHSRRSRLRDVPGQVALFSVKVIAIGAGLGAAAFKVLGKVSRHAPVHGAAAKALTAYHLKLAAVVTASTATLAIGGAVVITHYDGTAPGPYGSSAGAAPAASVYAGTPIPSSSLIARTVVHPKARRGSKKQLMAASGLPLPCCTAGPEPAASASSSSAAPSVQVSVQAGPAVLTVSAASLDLSNPLDPQASVTLSATGSGWVSWKIDTSGVDLDFSATHGVLQAGQSVQVTVSVDPAQALDGNVSQTFEVAGQSVTVALPPLVAPVASAVASVAPSVIPSGL